MEGGHIQSSASRLNLALELISLGIPWVKESSDISWIGMRLHPSMEAEKGSRCLGCTSSPSSVGTPRCLDLEAAACVSSEGSRDGCSLRTRPKQGANEPHSQTSAQC